MKKLDKNNPATLSEWLEIATNGLWYPARSRITLEIGTHYNEAVNEHLAGGCSKGLAEILALEELGNPKKARRIFRRRHLTEIEAKNVARAQGKAVSPSHLIWNFLIFGCFVASAIMREQLKSHAFSYTFAFLGLVAIPTISLRLSRGIWSKRRITWLLLSNSIEYASLALVLVLGIHKMPASLAFRAAAFMLFVKSVGWFFILKKIGNGSSDPNDKPRFVLSGPRFDPVQVRVHQI